MALTAEQDPGGEVGSTPLTLHIPKPTYINFLDVDPKVKKGTIGIPKVNCNIVIYSITLADICWKAAI